jgi:preprotein translocase subunit SecD
LGDVAAALGHQPVLVFRPVLAAAPVGLVLPSAPSVPSAPGAPSAPDAPSAPSGSAPGVPADALTTGSVPVELQQQFTALDCAAGATGATGVAAAAAAAPATVRIVACSAASASAGQIQEKLALGPVAVKGTDVAESTAADDQQVGGWVVDLHFNSAGSAAFAGMTGTLAAEQTPANQLAIVLDGTVVSHPYVQQAITGGSAVISGAFTEEQAKTLAAQLSAGLPAELRANGTH